MLGQRRRRWTNIKPALPQRLVCAGIYYKILLIVTQMTGLKIIGNCAHSLLLHTAQLSVSLMFPGPGDVSLLWLPGEMPLLPVTTEKQAMRHVIVKCSERNAGAKHMYSEGTVSCQLTELNL